MKHLSKLLLIVTLLIVFCSSAQAQSQPTRIVVTYNGPFGSLPATGSGSAYSLPITKFGGSGGDYMLPFLNQVNGHYEYYTVGSTLTWHGDNNGWGPTWPIDLSGSPDYIHIQNNGTLTISGITMWWGRVYKYKNGVMMHAAPAPIYRSHIQHPSGGTLPPLP